MCVVCPLATKAIVTFLCYFELFLDPRNSVYRLWNVQNLVQKRDPKVVDFEVLGTRFWTFHRAHKRRNRGPKVRQKLAWATISGPSGHLPCGCNLVSYCVIDVNEIELYFQFESTSDHLEYVQISTFLTLFRTPFWAFPPWYLHFRAPKTVQKSCGRTDGRTNERTHTLSHMDF